MITAIYTKDLTDPVDAYSFGVTRKVRNSVGLGNAVDECSYDYRAARGIGKATTAVAAGTVVAAGGVALAGAGAAVAATAGAAGGAADAFVGNDFRPSVRQLALGAYIGATGGVGANGAARIVKSFGEALSETSAFTAEVAAGPAVGTGLGVAVNARQRLRLHADASRFP